MKTSICSVPGCGKGPVVALGYCNRCYHRKRRGTLLEPPRQYAEKGAGGQVVFRLPVAEKTEIERIAGEVGLQPAEVYRLIVRDFLAATRKASPSELVRELRKMQEG